MIIPLHLDAGPSARTAVRPALDELGFATSEVRLGDRTALVTEPRGRGEAPNGAPVPTESIARLPFVEQVIGSDARAPLVSATRRPGGHPVRVGSATFGEGRLTVIAGPCTVEDGEALRETAGAVKAAGAAALRGGAFKVRTSPHRYQGGGPEALALMREVADETGLPFFTELTDPRQVERYGELLDGVQIGARHMQNFPLLQEVGKLGKPVLLKRHMSADLEEWLLAAEYLLAAGNDQVILCERGIKTGERHVRYMLDVGAVPWIKARVGLPVVVDPSHAAGHHALVAPLARAAVAAGADGLIVEVHPRPHQTRCDAMQALGPDAFAALMDEVRALSAALGRGALPDATPAAAAPAGRGDHDDGPGLRRAMGA